MDIPRPSATLADTEGRSYREVGFLIDESDTLCNMLLHTKENSRWIAVDGHPEDRLFRAVRSDVFCGTGTLWTERKDSFTPYERRVIRWIDAVRNPMMSLGRSDATFQPFQNLMVLDVLYYLISVKCPSSLHRVLLTCKGQLGWHNLTVEDTERLRRKLQVKHSVYIIPRRHGKTAMLTGMMAATLLFMDNITVAYGCHRSQPLVETYNSTLRVIETIMEEQNEFSYGWKLQKTTRESIRLYNTRTKCSTTLLFILFTSDKVGRG